ncbi:hypothetical protein [Aquaspirillum soli]
MGSSNWSASPAPTASPSGWSSEFYRALEDRKKANSTQPFGLPSSGTLYNSTGNPSDRAYDVYGNQIDFGIYNGLGQKVGSYEAGPIKAPPPMSFSFPSTQTASPPPSPAPSPYQPVFDSAVSAPTETIEGRINGLLAENNPVLRQAADKARAGFAARGLLNSSMAETAAMEAMIAKAVEIAGPDAQRYFQNRLNNVDWKNKFAGTAQQQEFAMQTLAMQHQYNKELATMQQQWRSTDSEQSFSYSLRNSYLQMTSQANAIYQENVARIQGAQMNPEDKAVAIQAAQQLRDNNIAQLNATFQAQPGWVQAWSIAASY